MADCTVLMRRVLAYNMKWLLAPVTSRSRRQQAARAATVVGGKCPQTASSTSSGSSSSRLLETLRPSSLHLLALSTVSQTLPFGDEACAIPVLPCTAHHPINKNSADPARTYIAYMLRDMQRVQQGSIVHKHRAVAAPFCEMLDATLGTTRLEYETP